MEKFGFIKICIVGSLRFYQLAIRPWLGQHCRFYPSCSEYMRQAVCYHGSCRGIWLGIKRLLRCHPGCPGGCDPVPLVKECAFHD